MGAPAKAKTRASRAETANVAPAAFRTSGFVARPCAADSAVKGKSVTPRVQEKKLAISAKREVM